MDPDPEPSGSGSQMSDSASTSAVSTVAPVPGILNFARKMNWSATIIERLTGLMCILDPDGRIKYVSPNITSLTQYTADEVCGGFMKDFIHPEDVAIFIAELDECVASGSHLRIYYRMRRKDGTFAIHETVGHAHFAPAKFAPAPLNKTQFCQAIIITARLYPSAHANLVDSFLEHKMENELLRRRIADLRREDDVDYQVLPRPPSPTPLGADPSCTSDTPFVASSGRLIEFSSDNYTSLPTEYQRDNSIAFARDTLTLNSSDPADFLNGQMAPYSSTVPHVDAIEILTGLHYSHGERRILITAGISDPELVGDDAPIITTLDQDRPVEKNKRLKTTNENVCTDCGTLHTPEWRRGPTGPKTLCNACGLRWKKLEKRRVVKINAASYAAGETA